MMAILGRVESVTYLRKHNVRIQFRARPLERSTSNPQEEVKLLLSHNAKVPIFGDEIKSSGACGQADESA